MSRIIRGYLQIPPGLYYVEAWLRHYRTHEVSSTSRLIHRAREKLQSVSPFSTLTARGSRQTKALSHVIVRHALTIVNTGGILVASTVHTTVKYRKFSTANAPRLHNRSTLRCSQHFTTPEGKHACLFDRDREVRLLTTLARNLAVRARCWRIQTSKTAQPRGVVGWISSLKLLG